MQKLHKKTFTLFPVKITSPQIDFMLRCTDCKLLFANVNSSRYAQTIKRRVQIFCWGWKTNKKKQCLLAGFIYTLIIAYSGELWISITAWQKHCCSATLSHQWSKVCNQQAMPDDRNCIHYSYVHIVLTLRLLGVTVGYYFSIFAFMFSALNTYKLLTNKVPTIYKMQKILQLKDIYNLEVSKFMYKCTTSQLPATFNNYFKLITDVHSYNTRQVKTRQFALPKARSNWGAKMIKYSAIEIWSKIPPEIKNNVLLSY